MTKWYHIPNTDWLRVRKQYLTASDFKELGPLYDAWQESEAKAATDKRYKPASKKAEFEAKVRSIYFNKKCTTIDTYETEAMRRGHCLEPIAVQVYCDGTGRKLYHWDDALLVDDDCLSAASPDALDIPQPDAGVAFNVEGLAPFHAIEVKCFNVDNHMRNYTAEDKMHIDKDVLYQITWQMLVLDVQDVTVLFFNPGLEDYVMKDYTYTKEDLAAYLDTAMAVEAAYAQLAAKIEAETPRSEFKCASEDVIAEQFEG